MPDEKKLPVNYTVPELAQILRRSTQTINRFIKTGKIPAIKIGRGYIISEETVQKILRGEIDLSSEDDEED